MPSWNRKLKKYMKKEDNNEAPSMFVLVKGLSASGEPQYAYVSITYEKYGAFLKAQEAGAYDLSAFGTILHHGSGLEPSIEVRTRMQEQYGVQHDFEQQIVEAIKTVDM